MILSKLTEKDKKEILLLYRETDETSRSIALRYNVSGSTITRFLKSSLDRFEYNRLIQQKRIIGRGKKISSSQSLQTEIISKEKISSTNNDYLMGKDNELNLVKPGSDPRDNREISPATVVKILPLERDLLPPTCYLVVNRLAELITKPLKEFANLGKIPSDQLEQITLPVFKSYRRAKSFSRSSEGIVKLPDSNILAKTSNYLIAKGITRLLLDGQVFALPSSA